MSELEDFNIHLDPFQVAERQGVQRIIVGEPFRGQRPDARTSTPRDEETEDLAADRLAATVLQQEVAPPARTAERIYPDEFIIRAAVRAAELNRSNS